MTNLPRFIGELSRTLKSLPRRLFVSPFPPEGAEIGFDLGLAALEVAEENMGRGEEGANNQGRWVQMYTRGMTRPVLWCAAFMSYCFEEGYIRILCRNGKKLHAERFIMNEYQGESYPLRRSHRAKTLYRIVGEAGAFVDEPLPGDLACWHRGVKGSRKGHVGIVHHVDVQKKRFWTIEGNRGVFPAEVDVFKHVLGEPMLLGFARAPIIDLVELDGVWKKKG